MPNEWSGGLKIFAFIFSLFLGVAVCMAWIFILQNSTDLSKNNTIFWSMVATITMCLIAANLPDPWSFKTDIILLFLCPFTVLIIQISANSPIISNHIKLILYSSAVGFVILVFLYCTMQLANAGAEFLKTGKITTRSQMEQNEAAAEQAEFENSFEDVSEKDEGFDYDEAAFSGGSSDKSKDTPRGFDKRHPDDAKLWAMVDDPAANANERVTAMQKIAEREARRAGGTTNKQSGGTGRTVAKGKS